MSKYELEELKKELTELGLRVASQDESGWYYGRTGVWVTTV